jgi:hypothetical protein
MKQEKKRLNHCQFQEGLDYVGFGFVLIECKFG